MLLTKFAKSR